MIVGATFRAIRTRFPRAPDGIIDELEIFDYALTGDQIEQIYDNEGACKVAPEPSPEVVVDIKPGSDVNPINLGKSAKSGKSGKKSKSSKKSKKSRKSGKGNGRLPVAILTTGDFDAATVDVSTVTLGDDDDDMVGVIPKSHGRFRAELEDVDDDGDLDLVMHFSIADLVAGDDLDESTTQLCINGETLDGDAIHGCDSVTIVGEGDDD